MDPILSLIVLYVVGMVLLIAEIFVPSHGVLTIAALGLLGAAVYETFTKLGQGAGYTALLLLLILLPTAAVFAVKNWHRTPVGRLMLPPNPVLTAEDEGPRRDLLEPLIGQVGEALTPLRPIGECRFGSQKVECVAESGMIKRGEAVRAIGIINMSLAVRRCSDEDQPATSA